MNQSTGSTLESMRRKSCGRLCVRVSEREYENVRVCEGARGGGALNQQQFKCKLHKSLRFLPALLRSREVADVSASSGSCETT
jgi:hypothetical protein